MKNLPLTAGVFVVVYLLAGTDVWPCRTHAATLSKHSDDATLLGIVQENELSRQKRQFSGDPGRKSPRDWYTREYSLKSRNIFRAHQILYGPLWQLHEKVPNPQSKHDTSVDLSQVLHHFKSPNISLPDPFKRNFPGPERFEQMHLMRNEISHQRYSVKCFEWDKKVLINVAEYLDGVNVNSSVSVASGGSLQRSRATANPSIRNKQTLKSVITSALENRGSTSTSSSARDSQCRDKGSREKTRNS